MEKTSLVVIESIENGETEWGLSFDGHNPGHDDYFKMANKETAFTLKEKLSDKYPPVHA